MMNGDDITKKQPGDKFHVFEQGREEEETIMFEYHS